VEQRCTCGAVLAEDARFCHKCGKPQYEEDVSRLTAQDEGRASVHAPPAPAAPPSPAPGISFKNSRAVLISILVAGGTLVALLAIGLLLPALFPLVLCGAGFVAARLYNGRSSQPLSTAGGARLGSMTGLWLFVVVAVLCAMAAISVSTPEGWEQAKSMWAQLPQASKLLTLSQHEFFMQLLLALPFFFFFMTLLPGLGGILGAKLSRRRHP
jgi:hypothetical protein